MNAGLAGVLLLGAGLLACGRQDLWKPGATGGAGGAGGGGIAGTIGAAGTTSSAAGTGDGGAGSSGGAAGVGAAGAGALQPSDDGFDVASLPGLVLWLDATRGVTLSSNSYVRSWTDQSPSGTVLAGGGQVGAQTFAPDRRTPFGELGSTVLHFEGLSTMASGRTNGTTTLGLGASELLVEVVGTWGTFTTYRPVLFSLGVPGSQYDSILSVDADTSRPDEADVLGFQDGALSSSGGLGSGVLHLVGVRRTVAAGDSTVELRLDGRRDATQTYGQVHDLLPAAYVQVGPSCDIAEVVVIKGPIADDALAALEAHLKDKYGI